MLSESTARDPYDRRAKNNSFLGRARHPSLQSQGKESTGEGKGTVIDGASGDYIRGASASLRRSSSLRASRHFDVLENPEYAEAPAMAVEIPILH